MLPLHVIACTTKDHEGISSQFIEHGYKVTVLWGKA